MPGLGGHYLPLVIQNVIDLEQGNTVFSGKVMRRSTMWLLAHYFPHCKGKLIIAYGFLQALAWSDIENLGLLLLLFWEMTRVEKFCVDIEAGWVCGPVI